MNYLYFRVGLQYNSAASISGVSITIT